MEQEKQKLEWDVLQYTGKELKGTGTKKDGQPWKKYALMFDIGGQYPRKYQAFDSISEKGVQVKDMEEGNYYEIGWKWNEFVGAHGPTKSRQAVIIKPSEESKCTKAAAMASGKNSAQTALNAVSEHASMTDDEWQEFAEEYETAVPDEAKTKEHMLAVYVLSYHKDRFSDIINRCIDHFRDKDDDTIPEETVKEKPKMQTGM